MISDSVLVEEATNSNALRLEESQCNHGIIHLVIQLNLLVLDW